MYGTLKLQAQHILTLPYVRGGCLRLDRHPALRPQHTPNAQLRQTSRSVEPLRRFGKLQEEKPMDISQRIQRKSTISKNVLSQKH